MKQEPGPGRRHWFESDGLDLVVWRDAHGAVTGFQLCYDFGRGEHALTWRPAGGFAHAAVDQGDDWAPGAKQSPVLVPDGAVPWRRLKALFDARSAALDAPLRQLVHDALAGNAATEP
ncbi:MAG TPA: hypothetical protein VHD62_09345 [Opitutaceae bacterium]|nr:hypothetical protein [Opitutaceae bacterium]